MGRLRLRVSARREFRTSPSLSDSIRARRGRMCFMYANALLAICCVHVSMLKASCSRPLSVFASGRDGRTRPAASSQVEDCGQSDNPAHAAHSPRRKRQSCRYHLPKRQSRNWLPKSCTRGTCADWEEGRSQGQAEESSEAGLPLR